MCNPNFREVDLDDKITCLWCRFVNLGKDRNSMTCSLSKDAVTIKIVCDKWRYSA